MTTHDELIKDLNKNRARENEQALELERLKVCYLHASYDDKRVIWAVLNKYVPFLVAEGALNAN